MARPTPSESAPTAPAPSMVVPCLLATAVGAGVGILLGRTVLAPKAASPSLPAPTHAPSAGLDDYKGPPPGLYAPPTKGDVPRTLGDATWAPTATDAGLGDNATTPWPENHVVGVDAEDHGSAGVPAHWGYGTPAAQRTKQALALAAPGLKGGYRAPPPNPKTVLAPHLKAALANRETCWARFAAFGPDMDRVLYWAIPAAPADDDHLTADLHAQFTRIGANGSCGRSRDLAAERAAVTALRAFLRVWPVREAALCAAVDDLASGRTDLRSLPVVNYDCGSAP